MPIKEIKKIIEDTNGMISNAEGELLFNLAKACNGRGVIVEIGSWKGTSTICLGKGSKEGNKIKIYAIDPHTGSYDPKDGYIKKNKELQTFKDFEKNIKNAKVDDIIIPLVKTSEEAAKNFDKPVELIFIDGDHEYEPVKSDFDLWFPKIINGGVMAFHDSVGESFPGPKRVVDDMVYKSKYFKKIGIVSSTVFAQKVELNSFRNRIENRFKLFSKNFFIFGNKLHLPKPIRKIGKKIASKLLNYKWSNN